VLLECYDQSDISRAMRDRYREETVELVMCGLLA
jgi:hypothetical protein